MISSVLTTAGTTLGTTLLAMGAWWLLLSFNGWTLIAHCSARIKAKSAAPPEESPCPPHLAVHPGAVLAIGLLPLSLLSLTPAITGSCPSGPALGLVMEGVLVASLLLRPSAARATWLGLSRQWPWRHRAILWAALAWSLAFAIWSTTWEAHSGVTPLLSNANPDLNAYIRRVAASLTENLHFDGVEACGYNWGSPKKLSSLLLALTIAPFPNPVQGITAFQGALAGAVLLVVFQDWLLQPFRDNGRPGNTARLLAAAWAITAPVPYWLVANSYLSQALFLILASVGYREMRRHQIQPHLYPESVWHLLLVALTTATYSFYPAFLPLLILALLLTQVSYGLAMAEPWLRLCRQGALMLLVPGLTVLLLVLTFTDQAELGEVSHSLNPMIGHASNFVPINPWSLLQESPKPMPNVRDFGWWFHLSLGLPLSLLGGLLCWRFWRRQRQPDLFAAVMGIAAYGGYLLLFFPLESTYRLMKLNGTLLYPLAVCGALPLVFALPSVGLCHWCSPCAAGRSRKVLKPDWCSACWRCSISPSTWMLWQTWALGLGASVSHEQSPCPKIPVSRLWSLPARRIPPCHGPISITNAWWVWIWPCVTQTGTFMSSATPWMAWPVRSTRYAIQTRWPSHPVV